MNGAERVRAGSNTSRAEFDCKGKFCEGEVCEEEEEEEAVSVSNCSSPISFAARSHMRAASRTTVAWSFAARICAAFDFLDALECAIANLTVSASCAQSE